MNKKNPEIEEIFKKAFESHKKNDFVTAEKFYNQILEKETNHFNANFFLGALFLEKKNFNRARELFLKAISINPDNPDTYNNLGIAMKELGQKSKSIICFEKAIKIEPNHKVAHNNLGIAFKESGEYKKAINSYEKAIEIDPQNADAFNNLGTIFTEFGEHEKSAKCFRSAIDLRPKHEKAYLNLLFSTCWLNNIKEYLELAKKYCNTIPKYNKNNSIHGNISNEKFLKIGFVSGDFRNHPVAYFLLDILKNLKKKNLKLFAYSNNMNEDEYTSLLKKNFDKWNLIANKNEKDIIELIKKDNIDILFDLSGHTKGNKLVVFKNKCAPIQVTWSGWLASTGIEEIDYIVGDPYATPLSDQKKFVEKIYQMKNIWQSLSISNLDKNAFSNNVNENNTITFGSFNNTMKLNDNVIRAWSKILNKIKNSKLFLKYSSFNIPEIKMQILKKFESFEVNMNQIIVEGSSPRSEYLKCYNNIDIALDSFPINGATTNFEAAFMGVPILTKISENNAWFKSGPSINNNLHLNEWIAKNDDEYISKAIKFSENKKYLTNLKKELRNKALAGPLFDSESFSENFYEMLLNICNK